MEQTRCRASRWSAPLFKLGRSTVYDLIRSRRLVSLTIGRSRRVPADAVRDFIDNQIEEAA
ncbi:helix-turn-helix domain-containing protein [Streptomyces sp. NPDC004787]|uniref:helix-turn-helix domain-containing protein n=1 Tax=Streptomyces sp. NPDC004787 TaxID=3154291 RepID=UPI0033BAEE6E